MEDFSSERHKIVDALTGWLGAYPKLQIFWTVVRFISIDVMHVLRGLELPPKLLSDHMPMLIHVAVWP